MIIGQIKEGIVLDHITAGKGMEIYNVLKLGKLDCTVAMIEKAESQKMGQKDIIKIGKVLDINLDVLGYIDPGITVNIIVDGQLVEKKKLSLPEHLVNVITCKNPRCITTAESQLDAIFLLSDPEKHTYRCAYCESALDKKF